MNTGKWRERERVTNGKCVDVGELGELPRLPDGCANNFDIDCPKVLVFCLCVGLGLGCQAGWLVTGSMRGGVDFGVERM